MAKRGRKATGMNATAESVGAALGKIAARVDHWKSQRAEIVSDIQKMLGYTQHLLTDLGHNVETRGSAAWKEITRKKGGRPKGYKMSAATKAKLRAAWKRRKAAATAAKPKTTQ